MARPVTSEEPHRILQRARYKVMRDHGIPSVEAKAACSGGPRFASTMARYGFAVNEWPELARERPPGDREGKNWRAYWEKRRAERK